MATRTEMVCGLEVNLMTSKDGTKIREATVMLGDSNRAGARAKDGQAARAYRMRCRREVAEVLGLPFAKVHAKARFSRIAADGSLRGGDGRIVGQVKLL